MNVAWGLALLGAGVPLARAWYGLAGTTLRLAWAWAVGAWGAWGAAGWLGGSAALRYLALSLTACAGVAVLGARRPGAGAWNFVVAGLLALLCRPYLEGLGELKLQAPHLLILAVALIVALGNYLPTRQAPAALLLAVGCGTELLALAGEANFAGWPLVALAPWAAWWCAGRSRGQGVNQQWRSFRDQYGFVWAQRLREQFNRAASNAGHAVELGWWGLREAPGQAVAEDELRALLEAAQRRFRAMS